MDYTGLKLEIKEKLAVITISRPEFQNALNLEVIESLTAALRELGRNKSLRALIITGEGKSFVAGADIKQLAVMKPDQAFNFSRKGQEAFERIEQLDFPVIAAVNGFALGGGCELALACDIRVASTTAKFGMPEVSLGLMPGFAGTQRLSRAVGYANAVYMMSTAQAVDATEALRIGLIQKMVEPDMLMEHCKEIATDISAHGKYAIRAVKELAQKSLDADFRNSSELESEVFAGLFCKPEADEGMKAFLEKRKPVWRD